MMQTRLGIVLQAPPCFRQGVLILGQSVLQAALAFFKRGGIPYVGHKGFEGRPGLWWDFLIQILHLVEPTTNPQRPRPHGLPRFAQARRSIRGDRDRGLESALDEIPQHFQTAIIALTMGSREREQHLPPIHADPPHTQNTGLAPPAA